MYSSEASRSSSSPTLGPRTFSLVLELESLASACTSALDVGGKQFKYPRAGSGLKVLRQVSKRVNEIMLRSVRNFKFVVDGVSEEQPHHDGKNTMQLLNLLRFMKLSSLQLEVEGDEDSHVLSSKHSQQVQHFFGLAGSALKTVKTLDLTLAEPCQGHYTQVESDKEVAALLSPLANICTMLQTLRVTGDVGAPLLAAFAASCEHLTSLETFNLDPSTAERLHELLPRVTSIHMHVYDSHYDHADDITAHMNAIAACRTLTSLVLTDHAMSEQTWRALPLSLQALNVGETRGPWNMQDLIPAGLHLPSLREVIGPGNLPLSQLANLLCAAPNLQVIVMWDVMVPRSADQIQNLVLLHTRVEAGLVVRDVHKFPRRQAQELVIQFTEMPATQYEPNFMQSLPVLKLFCNIGLKTAEPDEQFLFERLRTAFPDLKSMAISKAMPSSMYPSLAMFSLQTLTLTVAWNSSSALELGALCLHLPLLQHLNVAAAGLFNDDLAAECVGISAALRAWGNMVEVHRC